MILNKSSIKIGGILPSWNCEINELIVATFLGPRFRHFKFIIDKEMKRRLIEKGQNYIKIFANIIVNQM